MLPAAPGPEPARARKVIAAVVTLLIVITVWWVIEWRSAPPPLPAL